MQSRNKLQLKRNAKILLLIAGLFTIAIGLSNTFVNVFLWRIKQDFVAIGIFNLFIYIFLPITYILAGFISKKRNGTTSLKAGIIAHALFFILILILKKRAANYLIFLGSFLGMAGGFYWLAFQVLSFDLTNNMNRDTFNSYNGIVGSTSGMFAPLIAGFFISRLKDLHGYYLIFGISFALFIVIIIISGFLKTEKVNQKFKLVTIFKQSKQSWIAIMIANFFFGIRNGVLLFIVNLLVFLVTSSEFSVGKTTLIGAVLSTIAFEFIEKIMKPDKRKLFITTGAIMMFVAVLSLMLRLNMFFLILFVIINSFFTPFLNVPFNSALFNLIEKSKHTKERIEYIIYRELVLNAGRITGVGLYIYFAANFKDLANIKTFLLIVGSTQLVIPFLIKKINHDNEVL